MNKQRPLSRGLLFAVLSAICLVFAVGYVAWAALRHDTTVEGAAAKEVISVPISAYAGGDLTTALQKEPQVVFLSTSARSYVGPVAFLPLGAPGGPRAMSPLVCDRVHFAAGNGLCLVSHGGDLLPTFDAYFLDPDFQTRHVVPLNGSPSRARISPDGRYASSTVFVTGHSYADGHFSTETILYDTSSGTKLANLEQFEVRRNGELFQAADFNFWGVTFAQDSNRFYATLASGGKTYLVEGNVLTRKANILWENVECPSLSPDDTRIAFKKLAPSRDHWQINILDLATMVETPLTDTLRVDDQVEWLDNSRILYAITDAEGANGKRIDGWSIMVQQADGSGEPQVFVPHAYSPAVVR